tara:strand:+ start:5988 stop:6848 length:861 start_codon:yes stop_codon:yes gene_type:complete
MASDDNKWSKPTNPPPPLFLGEKERNLVKQVNDELLERVIGQDILYMPISTARTNFHPLYGESIEKSFLPPVRVYALVEFSGIDTTTTHYGLDKESSITVRFHNRRLFEDQNLYVREGDYVRYGTSFYEIVTLKENRQLFGQIEHIFQIEATCIKTRKGLINMGVLPTRTQAALQAGIAPDASESSTPSEPESEPESEPAAVGGDIVRLTYTALAPSTQPAGTILNTLLSAPSLLLEPSAIWEDGLRKTLTDSSLTGEFYLYGGKIYNNFEILSGSRLILEVLTIV